ncbi:MAG: hypothetical protein ACR2RE_14650 [Geminicoccaceae bacterium]
MYDMSMPNAKLGKCGKCNGSGTYSWGGTVNGKARFSGQCHSCGGRGYQTLADIRRDHAYNRNKLRNLSL